MRGATIIAVTAFLAMSVYAQTPAISDGGIVNSVTRDRNQPIAPGSIVSIFGSELAASSAVADSVPLSTSIAAVSVTFNNVPAPVRLVSPTLVSVQVPWEALAQGASTGTADVVLTRNGVASASKSVQVAQFSPGIYAVENLGLSNLALAMNADGTLAQRTGAIPGLNSHPAVAGDTVTLLATGLGPVDPPVVTGAAAGDVVRNVVTAPQVLLNGISASVGSATLASNFVGAYQVQITVPDAAGTGGALALQLKTGDTSSPNTTTMAVATP